MSKSEFYSRLSEANVSCDELFHMKDTIEKYLETMSPILPDCPSVSVLKEQLIAIKEMYELCNCDE